MPQRLAQQLISRGLVTARNVDEAMRRLQLGGATLDTALLELNAVPEGRLLEALGEVAGYKAVNLADFEPNAEAAALVPHKISRRLSMVPLSVDGKTLHIACTYPVAPRELKEVAFLLGKELEPWVALEVRVRDWQSSLYGESLGARFQKLLGRLDPARANRYPNSKDPTVDLSREDLERISRPKRAREDGGISGPKPALGEEHNPTMVFDSIAYSAYAKPTPLGATDDFMSTTVLDTTGYANFAKAVSSPADAQRPRDRSPTVPGVPAVNPVEGAFPGGVLPPRSSRPDSPTHREVRAVERSFVQPASAPRPHTERPRPSISRGVGQAPTRQGPIPAPPPVPVQTESAHTEFTEMPGPILRPSRPELPRVTPTPLQLPEARPTDETIRGQAPDWLNAPTAEPKAVQFAGEETQNGKPHFDELSLDDEPVNEGPVITGELDVPAAEFDATPAPPPTAPDRPSAQVPPPPTAPEIPVQEEAAAPPAIVEAEKPRAAAVALSPLMTSAAAEKSPQQVAPSEWTLAQARAALKGATKDRDHLLSVALDFGRRTFDFVGAFAVVRGAATGWDLRGELDAETFRQLSVPLDAPSVFRTVALTRGSYVGPLPPDQLTPQYLAQLGRSPRTVFLWPIEVKARLLAIIYGDCGSRPVSQRRLSDFILFCQDLPAAFGELILFRKQRLGAGAPFAAAPESTQAEAPPAESAPAPHDDDFIKALIGMLTGPDPKERQGAMSELLRTPEGSAKALAAAFPGPTAWSRLPLTELPEADELGPVAGALSRLGQAGAIALAPLLDSEDSDTRYLALLTSGSLKHREVLDGVLRGLFDLEPDISSAARAAATALKPVTGFSNGLKQLRQELSGRDPLRRSLAARALGTLHDKEAIEGLIGLTGSEDPLCSQSSAEALREICRVNFPAHPKPWLAWYAQHRERRRVDWLVDALESEEFDLRLSATEELSKALGDNLGFFADGPAPERKAAVERWRAALAARPEFDL